MEYLRRTGNRNHTWLPNVPDESASLSSSGFLSFAKTRSPDKRPFRLESKYGLSRKLKARGRDQTAWSDAGNSVPIHASRTFILAIYFWRMTGEQGQIFDEKANQMTAEKTEFPQRDLIGSTVRLLNDFELSDGISAEHTGFSRTAISKGSPVPGMSIAVSSLPCADGILAEDTGEFFLNFAGVCMGAPHARRRLPESKLTPVSPFLLIAGNDSKAVRPLPARLGGNGRKHCAVSYLKNKTTLRDICEPILPRYTSRLLKN